MKKLGVGFLTAPFDKAPGDQECKEHKKDLDP